MIVEIARNYFKLAWLYNQNPTMRQSMATGSLVVELNNTTNQFIRRRLALLISSTK